MKVRKRDADVSLELAASDLAREIVEKASRHLDEHNIIVTGTLHLSSGGIMRSMVRVEYSSTLVGSKGGRK